MSGWTYRVPRLAVPAAIAALTACEATANGPCNSSIVAGGTYGVSVLGRQHGTESVGTSCGDSLDLTPGSSFLVTAGDEYPVGNQCYCRNGRVSGARRGARIGRALGPVDSVRSWLYSASRPFRRSQATSRPYTRSITSPSANGSGAMLPAVDRRPCNIGHACLDSEGPGHEPKSRILRRYSDEGGGSRRPPSARALPRTVSSASHRRISA